MVVTTAVKLPTAAGFTAKVTVRLVAEALVTLPLAPLLNTTVFLEATASKPKPLITMVPELIAKFVVELVITGVTDAI